MKILDWFFGLLVTPREAWPYKWNRLSGRFHRWNYRRKEAEAKEVFRSFELSAIEYPEFKYERFKGPDGDWFIDRSPHWTGNKHVGFHMVYASKHDGRVDISLGRDEAKRMAEMILWEISACPESEQEELARFKAEMQIESAL